MAESDLAVRPSEIAGDRTVSICDLPMSITTAEEAREESPASSTLRSYGVSGIRSTLIRVAVIVARSPAATRLPLESNRSEIATAV